MENYKRISVFLFLLSFFSFNLLASQVDITANASLGNRYDDNITYSESNTKADFITSLNLGLNADYQSKRATAKFSGNLNQDLFWKYSDNHNVSQKLTFDAKVLLSKKEYLSFSESFQHAYEATSFEQDFGRQSARYSYYTNRFGLSYVKDFNRAVSAKVGVSNEIETTTGSGVTDSKMNNFFLEGAYASSSKLIYFARYDFLKRELDPGGDAKVNTVSAGVKYSFTEKLELESKAGLDFINSFDGKDYTRSLFSLTLNDRLDKKTSLKLFSFTKRHSTNPYTSDVFDSWKISSGAARQLLKRLNGSFSVFFGQGEYVELNVKDDLLGANFSLTYNIGKKTQAVFSYSYSQKDSNVSTREYKKNVIYLGIKKEF